jgi:hypothetical protein
MKVHQFVDARGLPFVVTVTAGQTGDSRWPCLFRPTFKVVRAIGRTRPDALRGKKSTRHAQSDSTRASATSQPWSRAQATTEARLTQPQTVGYDRTTTCAATCASEASVTPRNGAP